MSFDPYAARAEFPILQRQVNGRPLVYLDSAASAQKPQAVIDAFVGAMTGSYANVHRGLHTLANETTEAYEAARVSVAEFINAGSDREVVFTKGATEAINLIAATLGPQGRATRWCCPRWSTTPTSCPGTCCASARAWSCASSR
jgi:cysteine desulfurase/selenocysteine lyase